ncbi:hypothetical protein ADUPG1_012560 [Aduncisulcus paluster]|uniref:Uncharacterized protein n=1 Tax=Aduncisulcus paluster TaxID=2918883 RepID=A0ABQ5JZU4_9EUKA|nr:hypothetical protein ADUPG1_012560 [Aduncisulcus paluster]
MDDLEKKLEKLYTTCDKSYDSFNDGSLADIVDDTPVLITKDGVDIDYFTASTFSEQKCKQLGSDLILSAGELRKFEIKAKSFEKVGSICNLMSESNIKSVVQLYKQLEKLASQLSDRSDSILHWLGECMRRGGAFVRTKGISQMHFLQTLHGIASVHKLIENLNTIMSCSVDLSGLKSVNGILTANIQYITETFGAIEKYIELCS